jgi:hypothetical protein
MKSSTLVGVTWTKTWTMSMGRTGAGRRERGDG